MRAPTWRARLEAALGRAWWRPDLTLLSAALLPLSWLYGWLWGRRLRTRPAPEALPVPVLVVGNLVAGGAGKTPTVLALVDALRARGRKPAVISRGHGGARRQPCAVLPHHEATDVGDEPLLLARRSGVPVWIGQDRPAVAHALLAQHPEVDLLLADDGLQHLALHRDAELLLFDERGTGNGLLLPAGPLRQPVPRHLRPHQRVLYTAGRPTTDLPGCGGERRLRQVWPLDAWWRNDESAALALRDWTAPSGLWAAAGIAAPERFFSMLRAAGLQFRALPLPDHHVFEPSALPWPADAAAVLVTEKDATKLPPEAGRAVPIWVLPLDFDLPSPLVDELLTLLPPPVRPSTEPRCP